MATIRDCSVDPEIRDLVPAHTWQESAELGASVERFGYLSPIIVWRNQTGQWVVLDGHKRREHWLSACGAAQKTGGNTPVAPQVTEIEFASREDAMLWVLDNQTGRRNLSDLDRIALAAKRQQILRRMAKANQSAGGGDKTSDSAKAGLAILPKALSPIDSRQQAAAEAGVSPKTFDAGKQIIAAVSDGKLPPTVVADINAGTKSIHGVAKSLKAKPASKSKSGWQTIVSGFVSACRRLVKRDPQRRIEVATELRRLADEFEGVATAAA